MPTDYIRKLSKSGHGTVQHLEKEWEAAKADAAKQGKAKNFGYITQIFKTRVGASTTHLEAKIRLMTHHE